MASKSSSPSGATAQTPDVDLRDQYTDTHPDREQSSPSWKADALGDDRPGARHNISWGAVIAGVVTFLALTLMLSLITAALGLGMADLDSADPGEGVGLATGLWSLVTLVLALAAGGYVAGVLSGQAGLIHGFLTWATALLAAVVLASLLVGNILGAAGNVLGSATSTVTDAAAQNPEQAADAAPDVDPDAAAQAAEDAQEQAGDAVQDAAPEAERAADAGSSGALWGFAGLLIGAIIASVTGLFGARSVNRADTDNREVSVSRR
ncbi:TIGR04086 family membrane protein [Aquipuribacter sp. MA13-6]|uniref:TIGR04086 family membrane protein n=1 Tax=unclassified Aquipuribacter TaxID=2635084 RepID=UPI003EE92BE5